MDEILRSLPGGSYVLDLGCAGGSFDPLATPALAIRLDRHSGGHPPREHFVAGDAATLPFRDGAFRAVIANHSLEHFDDFEGSLREIGRVTAPGGALYIAVPDAGTLTDRIYRWLASGGGHVNAFFSPEAVVRAVERATGLRHVATRTLYSSLSFLNRRNAPQPRPRRLLLFGAGFEFPLFLYTWLSRRIDRLFRLRTSVYGWAFYFGEIPVSVDTAARPNVCIRCGSGTSAAALEAGNAIGRRAVLFRTFKCPRCGAVNSFIRDR